MTTFLFVTGFGEDSTRFSSIQLENFSTQLHHLNTRIMVANGFIARGLRVVGHVTWRKQESSSTKGNSTCVSNVGKLFFC